MASDVQGSMRMRETDAEGVSLTLDLDPPSRR